MNDLTQKIEELFTEVSPVIGDSHCTSNGVPYVVYGIVAPSVEQACLMLYASMVAKALGFAMVVPERCPVIHDSCPPKRLHWRRLPQVKTFEADGITWYQADLRCAIEAIV